MVSSLYHLATNCIIKHVDLFDLSTLLPNWRQGLFESASESASNRSRPLTDFLFQRLCPPGPERLNLVGWKISHISLQLILQLGSRTLKELRLDKASADAFNLLKQARGLFYLDLAGLDAKLLFYKLERLDLEKGCLGAETLQALFPPFPRLKTLRIKFNENEELRPLFSSGCLADFCPYLERVELSGNRMCSLKGIVYPEVECLVLQNLDCSPYDKFPKSLKSLSFEQTTVSMRCFKEMLERCKELHSLTFIGGSASVEALKGLYRYGGPHIKKIRFDGVAPAEEDGDLSEKYFRLFSLKWPGAALDISFGMEYGLTMTQELIPSDEDSQ